ncbi:MAG: aminotransferase class I/II-fold pyridoxal phosphate-dependent enzyme, partial [Bdellovibrionales bacterium]|nr:aminotransferase class I/II-fold pyridoxal phosphate-dependent enzyme [Bdellovibrionales bacterium]
VADQEALAIQKHFAKKRELLLQGLRALGIRVSSEPSGSFYCWGDLSALPEHLYTGMRLFREGLKEGVITVPGSFFDINPGQRRAERPSRYRHFARFSFGPGEAEIQRGLAALQRVIRP